jgi:hypothetical protein
MPKEITEFWHMPVSEQQSVKDRVAQEAKAQESGQLPTQVTLANAFDPGNELAVCSSSLFIIIVQDCSELGGGWRVQIIALNQLINKHFDYPANLEQVEAYLAEVAPYNKNAPVWVPLPVYRSGKSEIEYLKHIKVTHSEDE